MTPEDRVSYTMELQEDIAAKVEIIKANIAGEVELLPQGEKVPQDAQDYKDELKRVETFVLDLQKKVMKECDNFSEDVKYWAEYKTGIKSFRPWLEGAEKKSTEGLSKPQTLDEANAMFANVNDFDQGCLKHLKILTEAAGAANKMTTHKEADDEVAGLKERYEKVKSVSDEWMKKVDTLVKEWKLLDNTVTELNSWVAKDRGAEGEQQFSLEKMESTLGELKNIFKEKEKLVENL
jgi:soluble cytochrome b562